MMDSGRTFLSDRDFPLSIRTLFTGTLVVLGLGYAFGMLHVYNSHASRDGNPGFSAQDLVIAYSGNSEATKLEAALTGPMSGMLSQEDTGKIVGWVRSGMDEQAYEMTVGPIFDRQCVACHDGANPHIADLSDYDAVSEVAELDTGMDLFTLVRVSHIHMFGITFIFFISGLIFSYAKMRNLWLKSAIIALPFIAIIMDVTSWYLTKIYPGFSWVVFISGGVMGMSFAAQWTISMYQLWAPILLSRRN